MKEKREKQKRKATVIPVRASIPNIHGVILSEDTLSIVNEAEFRSISDSLGEKIGKVRKVWIEEGKILAELVLHDEIFQYFKEKAQLKGKGKDE